MCFCVYTHVYLKVIQNSSYFLRKKTIENVNKCKKKKSINK